MKFNEIIAALKEGKKVRRPSMSPVVGLYLKDDYICWYGLMKEKGEGDKRAEMVMELCEATDWEIYEETGWNIDFCKQDSRLVSGKGEIVVSMIAVETLKRKILEDVKRLTPDSPLALQKLSHERRWKIKKISKI